MAQFLNPQVLFGLGSAELPNPTTIHFNLRHRCRRLVRLNSGVQWLYGLTLLVIWIATPSATGREFFHAKSSERYRLSRAQARKPRANESTNQRSQGPEQEVRGSTQKPSKKKRRASRRRPPPMDNPLQMQAQMGQEGGGPRRPLRFQAGYSLSTDLADPVEPSLYNHDWSLLSSYQLLRPNLTLAAMARFRYASIGEGLDSEIIVDEQQRAGFVRDVLLFANRNGMISPHHLYDLNLTFALPTSPQSQDRGFVLYSEVSGGVSWLPSRVPGLNLRTAVQAGYLSNTYRVSPVDPFGINPDARGSVSLSLNYQLLNSLILSGSGSVGGTRYLDGTTDLQSRTGVSLSGIFQPFSMTLSYRNGSYADMSDQVNLFFIDQYRRIVSFSVRANF